MLDRTPFPSTRAEVRRTVDRAYTNVRANVGRLRDTAGQALDRLGTYAESYVATKIKRRVKPPIVVALVLAGVALAVALVAVFRK